MLEVFQVFGRVIEHFLHVRDGDGVNLFTNTPLRHYDIMELQVPNNSRDFVLQRARLLCHSAQFIRGHLRDLGVIRPHDSFK